MEHLIHKAVQDLIKARYGIALTGAGISTESRIPDFRGPDGIWTKNPEAEMKAYEVYDQFKANPKGYWQERLGPQGSMSRLFSILGEIGKGWVILKLPPRSPRLWYTRLKHRFHPVMNSDS